MVTLKELVNEQNWTGESDTQVIAKFFKVNNLEEEGMDLIHELTKSKIEKMNQKLYAVKEWTSYLPSKYLYEKYDLDTADKLHTLELDFISHGFKLSEARFKWAEENVPNIDRPMAYFNPLVDWLDKKGVHFRKWREFDE